MNTPSPHRLKQLENLGFAKVGASDFALFKNMSDAADAKGEDADAGKNQIFKLFGYITFLKQIIGWGVLCFCVTGCGYRFQEGGEAGRLSISVPYIKGDVEGQLNQEVVRALATDPRFDYRQNGGALMLTIALTNDGNERIGYRYDRDPTSGKRRKNIVATENRRTITAEVKLIDAYSEEVIAGPVLVAATADYDYVDSNSVRDLTFDPSHHRAQTVIDFSLGQLDSIEGAHDDTGALIYKHLAQKIVDGLAITAFCQ